MKSSFELAMERLAKSAPTAKVTPEQKARLAEIDSIYNAKLAERELFLQGQIMEAAQKGDAETFESMQKQLAADRKNLAAEREEEKEKVRQEKT